MIGAPRGAAALAAVSLTLLAAAPPAAQSQAQAPTYGTVFYSNGALKIEAYLYQPAGAGPFPLVIYNHGSRAGQERTEQPMLFIGRLLTEAGYAVLVPERRGYGKSDGPTYTDDIGTDKGPRMIARLDAEAGDVLAAVPYVQTLPSIDTTRLALMGYSFGGIVTVFAAGRSDAFVAAVNQASGSLSWRSSPALQKALPEAARAIRIPLLCEVAENDATTAAVKSVYDAVKGRGGTVQLVIFPPFTPARNPANIAPGHLIFSAQGVAQWQAGVLEFLAKYLGRHTIDARRSPLRRPTA